MGGGYFTIIDNADPESFELIYLNIGKDKHNVYYGGDEGVKVLNNADPSSFTVLTINDGLGGQPYASDIDTVFFSDIEIEDADTNSFVPISNVYSKDDNNVYYCQYSGCFDRECKIITDSDPTSFKVSSNDYIGLDKNYVYSAGEVIKNADPNSFQIIDDYRAEDKINKYRISARYKRRILKVSTLKCHTCFFFGLKRRPNTTTAVIIMVTIRIHCCYGKERLWPEVWELVGTYSGGSSPPDYLVRTP